MRGADLVTVHAWSWAPPARHLTAAGKAAELARADLDQIGAEAMRVLAAVLEGWRDKYPDVRVRPDVIHGHPARILSSYSARADLVVIGRHAHLGDAGPGIGTIQHALLDHAHGPIAIVPADG